MRQKNAFTLIELLVVVGILGILSVIALPNFRDATIKSRVARVKMDLRALSQGLQTYRMDHNLYPRKPDSMFFFADYLLPDLSTPIAYINSANVKDPFGPVTEYEEPNRAEVDSFGPSLTAQLIKNSYIYTPYISYAMIQGQRGFQREAYMVGSVGPDQMDSFIVKVPFPSLYNYPGDSPRDSIYNPSNGILSLGDIGYFGGDITVNGLLGG